MTKVSSGYTRTQILLHWTIALLVLIQFSGSGGISQMIDDFGVTASSAADISLAARLHVFAGITTFVLLILRLVMRLRAGAPALPEEEAPIMKMIAHATHFLLYVALFLMPLSGLAGWFGQVEGALAAHSTLRLVLLAFVFLHISGALYHQLILKNNLIKRMTFGK